MSFDRANTRGHRLECRSDDPEPGPVVRQTPCDTSIIWEYAVPLPAPFSLQRAQPYKISDDTKCRNVEGRVAELSVQYLPAGLLGDYCADQAAGRSQADGWAAGNLRLYTVAQLEKQHLWTRMDSKIRSLGGCDHRDVSSFDPHRPG